MRKKYSLSGRIYQVEGLLCEYCNGKASHIVSAMGWWKSHKQVPLCHKHVVLFNNDEFSL